MGGATSKLDENNWEKADGKLRNDKSTLDGALPTNKYGVYYLTKKGVNQREFDIIDGEKNLLYTTKAVPGTLACFDVSGREMSEYPLLRVTVDLARRYWIVYRYGVPTFEGQMADKSASEKVIAENEGSDAKKTSEAPSSLYKKHCVTVSWSRYMAVATPFGPPTAEMLLSRLCKDSMDDTEDELFGKASQIAARMKERPGSANSLSRGDSNEDEFSEADTTEVKSEEGQRINEKSDSPSSAPDNGPILASASMPDLHPCEPPTDPDEEPTIGDSLSLSTHSTPFSSFVSASSTQTKHFRNWVRQQSLTIREKSQAYLNSSKTKMSSDTDPLEGVIHFDGPLLLCQEIYNRIIGNHQTSLISKERVLELLKQDRAQHMKDHPDETDQEGDEFLLTAEEEMMLTNCASPGNGVSESKESELSDGEKDATSQDEDPSREQPLVGYWTWENTLRTQKVKMHVAKGADLALHIVLAIIVNQVRYERNAIAMTI